MKEKLDDEIFNEIYKICLNYIQSSIIPCNLDSEHLHIAYDFVTKKYEEISNLKNAFKIKGEYSPFTNIGECLDGLTTKNILGKSGDYVLYLLSKDIISLLKNLEFCYNILDKMIQEIEDELSYSK